MKKFDLLKKFSAICLVALFVFSISLGMLITHSIESNMIARSKLLTAKFIVNEVQSEFKKHELLTPKTGGDFQLYSERIKHLSLPPHVERIKIWNKDNTVVWSDNRELIGQKFPDNHEVKEAIEGFLTSEIKPFKKIENKHEKKHGRLLELYVPIAFGDEKNIEIVFEIYQNLSPLLSDVASNKKITWLVIIAGFVLLYLILFSIIWRTSIRLWNAQQQLVQSAKLAAIGELSANISHELKNPLTTIMGFTEHIERSLKVNSPDSIKRIPTYLKYISENSIRMDTIIKNMNEFSRKSCHTHKPIKVNEVLRKSFVLLDKQLRDIDFRLELDDSDPKVMGDENQLQQVFINLINNACNALQANGKREKMLRIVARKARNFILIDFIDNGPGIKQSHLNRVFEAFFTTKESGKGTGLGLSISHKIIEDHKGKIKCQSSQGKETIFSVSLPLSRSVDTKDQLSRDDQADKEDNIESDTKDIRLAS